MKIKKTLFKTEFEFDVSELGNLQHFIGVQTYSETRSIDLIGGLYDFLQRVFSK